MGTTVKHWFGGLAMPGVAVASRDVGAAKYWFAGLPLPLLTFTAPTPPTGTRRPHLLFSWF